MRCLTLARLLASMGVECGFICRDFASSGVSEIRRHGFPVDLLAVDRSFPPEHWLGGTQEQDAALVVDLIGEKACDWLVVDHYHLDSVWEMAVRAEFPNMRLLVIDDLANRPHVCDLLLDQTYGRTAGDYAKLVAPYTKLCLGTSFALLRPEFAALRERKPQVSNSTDKLPHILVTLGAGDITKPLKIIAKAFESVGQHNRFSATVIAGSAKEQVQSCYEKLPQTVEVQSFSDDMAGEMARADLAIGAGGGTSWERCCMGLPTVVLTLADNQVEIARLLHDAGAAISVDLSAEAIGAKVTELLQKPNTLQDMAATASGLCDGQGARRAYHQLVAQSIEFRNASMGDAKFVYEARYSDDAARFYRSDHVPTFDEHVNWFQQALHDDSRILLCASLGEQDIAHVRLDTVAEDNRRGEIGICLAIDSRGRGLGVAVLNGARQHFSELGYGHIDAEVHQDNMASRKIFEEAGYQLVSTDAEGFRQYVLEI